MTGLVSEQKYRPRLLWSVAALGLVMSIGLTVRMLHGQTGSIFGGRAEPPAREETRPATPASDAASIAADFSQEWREGDVTIAVLRGRCRITQRESVLTADEMVVWWKSETSGGKPLDTMSVYAEGKVRLDRRGTSSSDSWMFVELKTRAGVTAKIGRRLRDRPATHDALFTRAKSRRSSTSKLRPVRRAQIEVPAPAPEQGPELLTVQRPPQKGGIRRVRIFPRSALSFSVRSFESHATTPPEQVWVLTGGINMIIDGVKRFGTVDLSADRMIVWTQTNRKNDFQNETQQSEETPFEVYLEGNIVIRQGRNVIHAERATYDARQDRGLIHDAELKAFVPSLNETIRIRAERMRQISRNEFHAQRAWTSTSKFGKPGYRIQASDIFYENRYVRPWIGRPEIDPETGLEKVEQVPWVTSLNNTFYIEDVPVFYLPYLSAPAEDPQIPLRRLTIKNDRIFGTQVRSVWDMFALTGIDGPDGMSWELYSDYFSDRGPALGTGGKYKGNRLFGLDGNYHGRGFVYGVLDEGRDNLGLFREKLVPESEERYRVQLRHRQNLASGTTIIGEIGLLSDRNFLESYYERENDTKKDVETLLYIRKAVDNVAFTALGRPQVNDFETTTSWLPRADMYVLSEPFFEGRVTWSMHSSAGYGRLNPGDRPTDPTDFWSPLPFVAPAEGAALMTRHEINAPFGVGPVRFVPYLMGEAAFWGEDLTGSSRDRLYGSAGVRSSLMFWKVFPQVYSELLNLNGLAHKHVIEADYSYSDSSEGLAGIPQYNEFDDNAQERFRQRFFLNTFGGALPPMFEPRMYAVRSGAGRYVTAPYHELVDDQQVMRLAWRHQLQTKVGPPERLRIKDWMTLDLEASYFPEADRDNFGEDIGLLGAFYRWNVGDRTSILASAQYDLFDNAQQIWNLALLTQRGTRGSLYLGVRQIRGANLDSQILTASFSYTMSPKWVTTVGTAYDVGEARNAGQSLTVTRIGADFLMHFGATFDAGKGNTGVAFAIEPRFGPFQSQSATTQLSSLLGNAQ